MFKAVLILCTITTALAQHCDEAASVDITDGERSGSAITYEGITYSKGEYYTKGGRDRGCVCSKRICVRKCCPPGLGYHVKRKRCVPVATVFDPPVWDDDAPTKKNFTTLFQVFYGKMNCSGAEVRSRSSQLTESYHVQTDGRLYIDEPHSLPQYVLYPPDKYCVDTFLKDADNGSVEVTTDALVCFVDDTEEGRDRLVYNIVAMLVSCLCILVTVSVYSCLPELRNLHGRVLVVYLLCFFVGFALLAALNVQLVAGGADADSCVFMSIGIYFSLLSAFFWMNVVCFDIWWTFSGRRGLSLERLSIRGRMLAYSCYAFGVPLVLTAALAALEFSGVHHRLSPRLRRNGCFLDGLSRLLYLYGPILVLCVFNLTFFILTTVKIARIKRQTSVLKGPGSSKHDKHKNEKQRFILFVKLFIIMGVNWVLEVLSSVYKEPKWFWLVVDMYNLLIGLVIFLVFVCKKKIFRLIKKRYVQIRGGDRMSRSQTNSSRVTSSRDDLRLSSMKMPPT